METGGLMNIDFLRDIAKIEIEFVPVPTLVQTLKGLSNASIKKRQINLSMSAD